MNISSVDMSGGMPDTSLKVAAPAQTIGSFRSAEKTESSSPAQTTGGDAGISPVQVKQMVAEMQGHLDSMNISLQYCFYGVHDEKVAVKVVNKETGDVIREIPPKEMQALQTKMSELCGMIFNKKG